MDRHKSVFIEVNHDVYGSYRCPGFQFDNVVIIHATAIGFFSGYYWSLDERASNDILISTFHSMINELKQQQYFVNPKECRYKEPFNFKILRVNSSSSLSATKNNNSNDNSVKENLSPSETYSYEDLKLCLVHKYEEDGVTNDIFDLGLGEALNVEEDHIMYSVVPVFLFLMTEVPDKSLFEKATSNLLTSLEGIPLYPGLSIDVESTPFGNLAFYNSLSRGIICKILGPDQQGLIIDTRLTAGCEGAPIHVSVDGLKGAVIGIVVNVVGTCAEGCAGFSLCLNLKHLLKSVLGPLTKDYIPLNKIEQAISASLLDIDLLSSAVIFVRCQYKWGSGVVVDADAGLILTCAHIVNHALDSVYVVFKKEKYPAQVVYSSTSEVYDLALLKVGKISGLRSLVLADKSPVKGEPVFTVGYALSTESSVIADGTPTVTGGCVAKVTPGGGPLHSTCYTQGGVSGGAVLRLPNQLVGIVVSNIAMDTKILPYFNLAVSVDDFRNAVTEYISTGNRGCLQSLTVRCPSLKMKWMLQDCKL